MKKTLITTILTCSTCLAFVFPGQAEEKQKTVPAGQAEAAQAILNAPAGAGDSKHAEFMKKVSENSAKMLELKKAMDTRREQLYKEHPEIKSLWNEMAEMQKKINATLEQDEEYSRLVLRRDILSSMIPETPTQQFRGMTPVMPTR